MNCCATPGRKSTRSLRKAGSAIRCISITVSPGAMAVLLWSSAKERSRNELPRIQGILRILKMFCTQYRFQIANSADALFQHVSRHWNWGRYKICIWFRNFSVSSVFIRTNPYLNSAHGKGSAFPANLLYGWVRIGTESRGNQYGRTRSADIVFLRPESLFPNNTDRTLDGCET